MTAPESSDKPDTARIEQGISVWQVTDYEDIAAASKEDAIACAVKEWGYESPEQAAKEDAFDPEDVFLCDLDARTVNLHEDSLPEGPIVTYRENLRTMIAEGKSFPCFFAGRE